MSPDLASILPYLIIAALLAALAAWLIIRNSRRTDVIRDEQTSRDVLDEGASPATRNQALIDAPHAIEKVFGTTSANANAQATGAATADADAEAGPAVAPTRTAPPPAAQPHEPPQEQPLPSPGPADDLARMKGVGPKLVALLAELGITRFEQIAHWNAADIERIDNQLGRFKGRIERDQWVEQAKLLMHGEKAEFEAKFGNN